MPNNNLSAPQESVHANSKSVLQNAALRRKLEELPASTQTLTLSISNEGELSAPTFHPADHDSDDVDLRQFETVQQEVNSIGHAAVVPGRGQYVPVRRLASLADGSTDDVDYRIVGQLGSGGTGVVYQAHQRAIDREVALKVLKDNLNESDSSRERFLTEARVIGGLDHPNV